MPIYITTKSYTKVYNKIAEKIVITTRYTAT